jgi:hypothetical protein
MDDVPELMRLLLSVFTDVPQPAVAEGLHRSTSGGTFVSGMRSNLRTHWKTCGPVRLATFYITKKSGLVFAHMEYGHHQLLLAHLCALHKTDLSVQLAKWNVRQFHYSDPIRMLADEFVCDGYGLFLSTLSDSNRITVGRTFAWEPLERVAFGRFEQDVI